MNDWEKERQEQREKQSRVTAAIAAALGDGWTARERHAENACGLDVLTRTADGLSLTVAEGRRP